MIYYDRIDVSEGIDVNKLGASKGFDICCYWYFLDEGFKFQPGVFNGCHDVLMMFVNINDFAILNILDVDYRCIVSRVSESEALNLSRNAKKLGHQI